MGGTISIGWSTSVDINRQKVVFTPYCNASRYNGSGKGLNLGGLIIKALGQNTFEVPLPERAVFLPDAPWGGQVPEYGSPSYDDHPSIFFLSEAKELVSKYIAQLEEILAE
jgi:hypothetical protein